MKAQWTKILFTSVIIIYALGTGVTVFHHEPWRDEAYAWLVARDTSFIEMFRIAALEGHPSLWYLLLRPFAKLGLPYFTVAVIQWILAVITVGVFLWRAPFSKITKVVFTFSYYMFWEYCVSVRFYTLSILMIFILLAFYRDRFRLAILYAVILALLFNVNIHMEFLAGALLLAYVRDYLVAPKKRPGVELAIVLMALGVVAVYLQVGKAPDTEIHGYSFRHLMPRNVLNAVAQAFFVSDPQQVLALAGYAILALVGYVLITRPVPLMVFSLHVAGLFFLDLIVTGGTRHHGLILIGVLASLWLAVYYPDSVGPIFRRLQAYLPDFNQRWHTCMVALNLSLLMALPFGVRMHRLDLKYQYSGSKKMAHFILANNLDRYPIAAWRDAQTFPVLPYLAGKQFWVAGLKKYRTYYISDKERRWAYDHVTYGEALQNIDRAFPDNEPVLILLDAPLDTQQMPRYRLLFKVDNDVFFAGDERLYLYARLSPDTDSPPLGANRALAGPQLLPPPQNSPPQ